MSKNLSRKNAFQNLYNKNPETGAYIIEISLDDYAELFNGWDASPLRRRDLEPELLDYLEQAGYEIPLNEQVELWFFLPANIRNEEKEQRSLVGIKNNFQVVLFFIERQLKKIYRQIVMYMTLSIMFIVSAYVIRDLFQIEILFSILIEGLFIGGWFLLWESFSLFFFSSHEIRYRKQVYSKFYSSPIYFKQRDE
jgi:hypothetical protein